MPKSQNDFCLFLGLLALFTLPFFYFSLFSTPSQKPTAHSPSPVCLPAMSTIYTQTPITLPLLGRGSHLITPHIISSVPDIKSIKYGLLHLFLQHTSCALTMNENWDSDVRADMSDALDRIAPEDKKGEGLYRHDAEGTDDMPVSILRAITQGKRVGRPSSKRAPHMEKQWIICSCAASWRQAIKICSG